MRNNAIKGIKKALFLFIFWIPSLFLILSFANAALGIHRINNDIDHDARYERLKGYFGSRRAEVSLKESGSNVILECVYKDPSGGAASFKREIPFGHSDDDYLIYIYGSSPIVSKPPVFADGYRHFPDILEENLNSPQGARHFRIFNFGMKWADSHAIEKIAEATVNYKRPDLIIVYYEGGVDYELAYRAAGIKDEYYLLKSSFLKRLFTWRALDRVPGWKLLTDYGNWFVVAYVEPALINLMQRLNLIKVEPGQFVRYNKTILDDFKANISRLVRFTGEKGVPVVIATCLDNLEARPFGIYAVTEDYYRKGVGEKDYNKRMEYLEKAKDSEIFTGDLRAKSEAREFLTGLDKSGYRDVYIFDLRRQMLEEEAGFGYEYFYDYGHLKPKANALIAARLGEFLRTNSL